MCLCQTIVIALGFFSIKLIISSSYSQELRSFRYSYSTPITYFLSLCRTAIAFTKAILLHAPVSIAIPSAIRSICASSSTPILCYVRPASKPRSFDLS
jgi:hypothetical protein